MTATAHAQQLFPEGWRTVKPHLRLLRFSNTQH